MTRFLIAILAALVLLPSVADAQNRAKDRHKRGVLIQGAANVSVSGATVDVLPELVLIDGLTATGAELNLAVLKPVVSIADADYTFLAANNEAHHHIVNVTADRTLTLPAPTNGLHFHLAPVIVAADGHDWIIDTGSDTNSFINAIEFHDTDASPESLTVVAPNGTTDSILQVNLPDASTHLGFVADGTNWLIEGHINSTTAPVFSSQP